MSILEDTLLMQIKAIKLPTPEREYKFHATRRFRFDFAYPDKKLAIEAEGGTWGKSRHTTGTGYAADCEKYNLAILAGWRVLRCTGDHIKSGIALKWIEEALHG